MVHSVAGLIAKGALTRARPFRSPHHSASMAALTGGGLRAKPGEVSAWRTTACCSSTSCRSSPPRRWTRLRQPLETGEVDGRPRQRPRPLSGPRAAGGGDEPLPLRPRRRRPRRLRHARRAASSDYQSRISGPLMDRIDLQVEVPAGHRRRPGPAAAGRGHGRGRRPRRRRPRHPGERAAPASATAPTAAQRPRRGRLRWSAIAAPRRRRPRAADPRRRGRRPHRPRLDPHPAAGPHHRRPGRLRRPCAASTSPRR